MKNPRPPPRCIGVERVGRGRENYAQYLNRESGVFAVAVAKFFQFFPDWHQNDRVHPLVRQYQLTLDAILRDHPDLASCAVHCRHCGIRFLTHPRNANRRDLRCPFGCREHHRRQQANKRSQRHYRTDQGRRNKKGFNGKRSAAGGSSQEGPRPEPVLTDERVSASETPSSLEQHGVPQPRRVGIEPAARDDVTLVLDGFALDEVTLVHSSMLPYLAMVASLVAGHAIEVEDLLQALRRSMRQRSFDRLPRREYVLGFLDQHPP